MHQWLTTVLAQAPPVEKSFTSELLAPQVLWPIVIGLIVIVSVLAEQWRKVRQREIDATLKLEMIKRGMTADEIERVFESGSKAKACAAEEE